MHRYPDRFLFYGEEVITILRAVHKYKDAREQFEQTHKRLIDIIATARTTNALTKLELPAGGHRNQAVKSS